MRTRSLSSIPISRPVIHTLATYNTSKIPTVETLASEFATLAYVMYDRPPCEYEFPLLSQKDRFVYLLSQSSAYHKARLEKNDSQINELSKKVSESYIQFEQTETRITEGKYVDRVKNAKQIIAIGDIHGDVFGLCQMLLNAGVLVDADPSINRRDSKNLVNKYAINPDLPKGTQIVLSGDYVDRGNFSMEVIGFIMHLKKLFEGTQITVHALRGNHEAVFLNVVKLFGNKSHADLEKALDDKAVDDETRCKFDFSHELADVRRLYLKYGINLDSASLKDINFDFSIYSFDSTYESILRKYNTWENAVIGMKSDGTLDFLNSLKGAVIIDGNFFTHAGPPLFADSIQELEEYYEFAFTSPLSIWSSIGNAKEDKITPNIDLSNIMRYGENIPWLFNIPQAKKAFDSKQLDLSVSYLDQWDETIRLEILSWLRKFNFNHLYVGHNGKGGIFVDDFVTNLDARLSEHYGEFARGGVVIIDPLHPLLARVLKCRPEVKTYDGYITVPKIDFEEVDITDFRPVTSILSSSIGTISLKLNNFLTC